MRNLILKMSMTIDGFVGGPNGESDWSMKSRDAAGAAWTAEILSQAGAHLLGRKSFQSMATFWPSAKQPVAAAMNEIPKIAFSRTGFDVNLPESAKNWGKAQVLTGDLTQEITALKKQPGKSLIAHGGFEFAQSLIQTGLIDEYCLVIHPVAIGRGMALFSGLRAPLHLELLNIKSFGSGTIVKIYRPNVADVAN